jgi:hypothetical protein
MTRQELHDLAAAGVANRIRDIERELAEYHREWPTLFLTPTPPQLLAAAKKAAAQNGNGAAHWPAVAAPLPGLAGKILTVLATTEQATTAKIKSALGASDSGLNRAINNLVAAGRLVKRERGVYTTEGAIPDAPMPKRKTWTPTQRKAAATRMRAMHKDGRIARGIAKAKRAKQV